MAKILLVEDDQLLVKMYQTKFELEGLDVEVAFDGREGLQKALELHPDLILLDILMPKMDGLTMLAKLREDDWGKNADVVLLTNLSSNEKIWEAEKKGVRQWEYFVKSDWTPEELVQKVKEKLGING